MVPIRRGILSIFMTRDGEFLHTCDLASTPSLLSNFTSYLTGTLIQAGTIITLTRRRFREVVNPIYERLEDDQSLLRRSADASMLAQAFLDIAADLAVEVSR